MKLFNTSIMHVFSRARPPLHRNLIWKILKFLTNLPNMINYSQPTNDKGILEVMNVNNEKDTD